MDFTPGPLTQTQGQGMTDHSQSQTQSQNVQYSGYPAASGTQAQGPSSGGPSNPMYHAFEDFEREARQKKFMIAEVEDEIANLKKELDEVRLKNKQLGEDCEKLEIEAQAAEMKFEKMRKDKTLLLAEYDALSSEMKDLNQNNARKQAQKTKQQLVREEQIDLIKKKSAEFMAGLRRIPSIAQVLNKRESNAKLRVAVEQQEENLKALEKQLSELNFRYPDEWETFVKKCIKIAEMRQDLKAKLRDRDQLKAAVREREKQALVRKVGYGKYLKLGLGEPRSFGMNVLASPRFSGPSSSNIRGLPLLRGPRMCGMIPFPAVQQNPTFKAIDRILKPRHFVPFRKQDSSGSQSKPRKRMTETSLIDQLRSQIRGAVAPNPPMSIYSGKQPRIAAAPQQQIGIVEVAPQEVVRVSQAATAPLPPVPASESELGNRNPTEVTGVTQGESGASSSATEALQVSERAISLENAESAHPVQPSTSTQALIDKTMAMTSQTPGSADKGKEHIPNPPYLPFTAPPSQTTCLSPPTGLFGCPFSANDSGDPSTAPSAPASFGGSSFFTGNLFTSPLPPSSTGNPPPTPSFSGPSSSLFF